MSSVPAKEEKLPLAIVYDNDDPLPAIRKIKTVCHKNHRNVLRLEIKPGRLHKKMEAFTIQFVNAFVDHCDLQLLWENTVVSLRLESDVNARVMANIDELMEDEKKPYYVAAIYYYNNDKDMKKALSWINESDKSSLMRTT